MIVSVAGLLALAASLTDVAGGDGQAAGVAVTAGRTTAVVVTAVAGQAVERAVPGRAFAQAVAQDRAQRWPEEATLRATDAQPPPVQTEAHLLLCATHAAAGARQAARLSLARVTTEQRQEPANALAMAVCAAALGDQPRALAYLESHLRQRIDA